MQLLFIRHAQSENNALWANTGADLGRVEDPELTETGIQQAQAVAGYIQNGDPKIYNHSLDGVAGGFRLTHLYTSLMVRAVKTGMTIAEATGLPLQAWEALHECGGIYLDDENTGQPVCLPGKNLAYFETHYPGLVLPDGLPEAGWWNSRPVETAEQWKQRAQLFLEDLVRKYGQTEAVVGVVSHGGFYTHFLRAALKMQGCHQNWFTMYNTALSLFDFKPERVELVFHNRVDHLPGELVT